MVVFNLLILLSVVFLLVYITKLLFWALRAARKTVNIPGPKPLPILGSALYFINIKDMEDAMQRILNLVHTYCHPPHKLVKFWLGPKLIIALGNPKHIEVLLSSEHAVEKDSIYRFMHLYFSGMFVLNGKKWAELRKPLNPMLTKKMLENSLEMFHNKAIKLIKILDRNVDNDRTLNIKEYLSKYTEDVFFMYNFDADRNEIENEEETESLDHMFDRVMDSIFKAMVTLPYCFSYTYTKMTALAKSTAKPSQDSWAIIHQMTQQRKLDKNQRGAETNKTLFADLLLEKGEKYKLSPHEIGKLGTDVFVGGSHSLGLMSSAMVLLLAMYPKHQDAVYKEQLEIMGDDPEVQPTWEQLSKMTYLTRVFKEVTRLFAGPIIGRNVRQDIDLGDFKIPAGSSAVILVYSLHRDPTIWSHPEEFYPDHFLPEESARRPKFAYIPFSWGPRGCPGTLYAATVCKILLSVLIRKYYFKTDLKFEELILKFSLFVDVAQGHMVKKIPRSEMNTMY